MEFVLTVLAGSALLLRVKFIHLILLLLHVACGLWFARRLMPRQPLAAFFILIYTGMYFFNPIAIILGLVPLELQSDDSVFLTSNALLMMGLDLFIIGARRMRLTRRDANRMPRLYLQPLRLETAIALTLVICTGVLFLLIAVVGRMNVDIFTVSKKFRAGGGEQSTFYLLAAYSLTLLPLCAFLVGLKKPVLRIPYFAAMAFPLVIHFMIFRVRVVPVACLVAYLTALIVRNHIVTVGEARLKSRVSRIRRLSIIVALPILALVGVSIKYLRASYAMHDYAVTPERVDSLVNTTFASGDLGQAYYLRRAMTLFPHVRPYLKGQSYYRLLFVPIPRSIWPGKPPNTSRVFAEALDPDRARRGLTVPAGLAGTLYINFGYLGVLGMLVFGIVFGQERYRSLTDLFFLAGSGYWIFYLVRGATTNPVVLMVTVWIFSAFLTRIIGPVRLLTIEWWPKALTE